MTDARAVRCPYCWIPCRLTELSNGVLRLVDMKGRLHRRLCTYAPKPGKVTPPAYQQRRSA